MPQILKGLKGMSTFHKPQNTDFLSRLKVGKPDTWSEVLAWNLRWGDRDSELEPVG